MSLPEYIYSRAMAVLLTSERTYKLVNFTTKFSLAFVNFIVIWAILSKFQSFHSKVIKLKATYY